MKNLLIILFSLLSFTNSLFATYYDGYFIDNKNIRTECQIKMFVGGDEEIKYKLNGSKLKIYSTELKETRLYGTDSNDSTVVYNKYKAKHFSGKKLKETEVPIWAYKSFSSDKIEAFFSPFVDVDFGAGGHRTFQIFRGFIKLPSYDFILFIYEPADGLDPFQVYDKHMRSEFMKFLGETCPDMSKRVENQKYKCEDFLKMVEEYSKTCK